MSLDYTTKAIPVPLNQIRFTGEFLPGEPFSEGWLLFVTLVPLLLYIIVISRLRSPFLSLSRVVFSSRFSAAAYRNRTPGAGTGEVILTIIGLAGLATLLYYVEVSLGFGFFGLRGILLWGFNLLFFSISLAARFAILGIAGEMTGTSEVFGEYGYNISQIYRLAGIVLLPVNFMVPYMDAVPDRVIIYTGLSLVGILIIIRFIRLISLFIRGRFSLFYLILYLCALEFTPVLVIVRFLYGRIY